MDPPAVTYEVFVPIKEGDLDLVRNVLARVLSLSVGYVWHYEEFHLEEDERKQDHKLEGWKVLRGSTCIGDNTEDEWFIVWLLSSVTEQIPGTAASYHNPLKLGVYRIYEGVGYPASDGAFCTYPDPAGAEGRSGRSTGSLFMNLRAESRSLSIFESAPLRPIVAEIRVWDEDGEILLIEAAESIPKWASRARNTTNRVFLFNGVVHLIPPPALSPKTLPSISLQAALSILTENADATRASDPVQEDIQQRIRGYPEKMEASFHRANVYLPASAAVLLKSQPSLLSPAVHAFVQRDPMDAKVLRAMRFFPPESCVRVRVTFTRHLYAMLMTNKFTPDLRTGWKYPKDVSPASPEWKEVDTGIRLACGFELLASSGKPKLNPEQAKNTPDFEGNPKWEKFLDSLKNSGYFRHELPGSKLHVDLMSQAKSYFRNHLNTTQGVGLPPAAMGQRVHDLLAEMDLQGSALEELKKNEKELPASDDDSWLHVNPEDLEDMLSKKFNLPNQTADDLTTLPDSLNLFLNHMASYEGAEAPAASRSRKTSRDERRRKVSLETMRRKISSISTLSTELANMGGESMESAFANILNLSSCDEEDLSSMMAKDEDDFLDSDDDSMSEYDDEAEALLEAALGNAEGLDIQGFMKQMDRELEGQISLSRDSTAPGDEEQAKKGAMENILAAYVAEGGRPGPASNLLRSTLQ
ncbi:unnamed protein product [Cyprideis torosa]|uniref:Uncharacterized protein n=1 Tax=Cyprideis torosa TaxID=163714 RepID=A0A7R8ZKN5_9CRUS|nr:unnamed protein product [Cyprideis torosa]CAG0889781.1 unnamed protein product [Cyprideis torosa]